MSLKRSSKNLKIQVEEWCTIHQDRLVKVAGKQERLHMICAIVLTLEVWKTLGRLEKNRK